MITVLARLLKTLCTERVNQNIEYFVLVEQLFHLVYLLFILYLYKCNIEFYLCVYDPIFVLYLVYCVIYCNMEHSKTSIG